MSLYTDASLIMFPSGYKEDKIYSLKPTDGAGDLTFTRASTATRVNSEGLIEKVRTNNLINSNDFSSSGAGGTWSWDSATTSSGESGYDGTNNAWLLSSTSGFITSSSIGVTSGLNTFSVYAKKGTADGIRLRIDAVTDANCYINLNDGSQIIAYTGVYLSVASVGSGWYRIALAINDATVANLRFYATNDTGSSTTGTIYIQNAQWETGDIATPYIPTTTAAVSVGMLANVPRIDYTGGGCGKLLLEPQRTNLALYSEQFNNAVWVKFGSTSVTANTAVSPDGYTNADTINTSGTQVIRQSVTLAASTVYTYSIFVKKTNYDFFGLQSLVDGTGVKSLFNLSTGAVSSQGSGHTANIVSYGNGWYRCVITFNSGSSTLNIFDLTTDAGSTLRSFYCYGAQIE